MNAEGKFDIVFVGLRAKQMAALLAMTKGIGFERRVFSSGEMMAPVIEELQGIVEDMS